MNVLTKAFDPPVRYNLPKTMPYTTIETLHKSQKRFDVGVDDLID